MDCKGSPTIDHGDHHHLHVDPVTSSISNLQATTPSTRLIGGGQAWSTEKKREESEGELARQLLAIDGTRASTEPTAFCSNLNQ
ncbi:hypothetical protein MRB53_025774 [Persea americana]|uniref:Uncharacterized protein n=1 Tax=Persea americana TaxID=3435 RepID=A0ACC2LGH6_PERAE|nr:hypothetical protein MRB53_025774 [Persea americana]